MKLIISSISLTFSLILLLSFNNSTEIIHGVVFDETGVPLIGASVVEKGTSNGTITDIDGKFQITVQSPKSILTISYTGYSTEEILCVSINKPLKITMSVGAVLEEVAVTAGVSKRSKIFTRPRKEARYKRPPSAVTNYDMEDSYSEAVEIEEGNYSEIVENAFKSPTKDPLSTLSIDVDRASYANVRRFLNSGVYPPADAIRVEEMINYFDYDYEYKRQKDDRPFTTFTELAPCAWNGDHRILKVGLKAQKIERKSSAGNNLVFLIDVSGSMGSSDKLPLLKSAFKLLVGQMEEQDKVSIVVYAGAAGVVLEPTCGDEKTKIISALSKLKSGGSTAGGAGIELAYKLAKEHFIDGGNNRVILATDGDFNVGTSGDDQLVKLIERKRDDDIFLSILGFGTGNYMDGKMQKIAGAGNGNHNYIDNMREAKKVLMDEFSGTLYTVAKDVKIQIEFNPQAIDGYRMIGYENRVLAPEDFNNDAKDAGEMGADHTVTVLYEIIPKGVKSRYNVSIDPLKYQGKQVKGESVIASELGTIKYRYKTPTGKSSVKSEEVIQNRRMKDLEISPSTEWASFVAEFGLLLRNSSYKADASYDRLIANINTHLVKYPDSYKEEMLDLVVLAKAMERR